jgi:hypothetical protein
MQRQPNRRRSMIATPGRLLLIPIAIVAISTISGSSQTENITGTIPVKKQLTDRRVSPDVSIYRSGTAVELGKYTDEAPLDCERARVVIFLEGPGPASTDAASPGPFRMEQINRQFSPDLIVGQAGSTLSFPNMDAAFQNIFPLSKPGIVEVRCHLHPNMAAAIIVTPNRWYARSERSGRFQIRDVPPGRYTIVAWHKSAGFFRKSTLAESGHDSIASFFIPISEVSEENEPVNTSSANIAGSG